MKDKGMEEFLQVLGTRIRDLRNRKGYSIEKLAHEAGLHPTYLGEIERAVVNPSIISLKKIADALKIPLSQIFEFDKDEKEKIIESLQMELRGMDEKKIDVVKAVIKGLKEL